MSDQISGTQPILCAPLLRHVDARLIQLLRDLRPDEWELQTIAPAWKVRDVVAHLLDTVLRKLSMVRDHFFVEQPQIRSEQDVIELVNRLNREGVTVYRRLSPPVLIEMMETACRQSAVFHESLDSFAPAAFSSVSWAGESTSLNWFDTARELTERWHHQQQIRLATERLGIMTPELYHPDLDCFVRGLPHAFRDIDSPSGTTVQLDIAGDCGGTWLLAKDNSGWAFAESANSPAATVIIPQEIAWRVFTKGIDRKEAIARSSIEGDAALGERVFHLTAIVG